MTKAPFLQTQGDDDHAASTHHPHHHRITVFWSYDKADPRKTTLWILQPKFRLQISFGMQSTAWIPPLRLVPNRGNVGTAATINNHHHHSSPDPSSHLPTPHYNHALLEDVYETKSIYTESSLVALASETAASDDDGTPSALRDAAVLAKIWCLQRGLLRAHDGVSEAQLRVWMEYLRRTKKINLRLAPTQILAAWFKLLVETNFLGDNTDTADAAVGSGHGDANKIRKAPSEAYRDLSGDANSTAKRRAVLVLPLEGLSEMQTVAQSELAKLYAQQTRQSPLTDHDPPTLLQLYQKTPVQGGFAAVLLDPSMTYNFLHRWSPSLVRMLQREARKSLDQLFAPHAFDYLFLSEARFWTRYDAYLRVKLSEVGGGSMLDPLSPLWGGDRLDVGEYESAARGLVRILSMALGDRVRELRLLTTGNGRLGPGASEGTGKSKDSDEIPRWPVTSKPATPPDCISTPSGCEWIVIGLTLNSETCARLVDRGPPAEDTESTNAFLALWGSSKAQLRRFKDGAIVHAVVWDSAIEDDENKGKMPYVRFENDDKLNGGIVERIVRHIVRVHFLGNPKASPSLEFSLRGMLSAIDGVLNENDASTNHSRFNQLTAHRQVVKAYESLAQFLRKHSAKTEPVEGTSDLVSRLGIPLSIDAVEPLSPVLRYAEVFPPLPHPLLGETGIPSLATGKKVAGAVLSDPIEIQIRFGPSSKWPTDLKAIGAAKCAMLVQMIDGMTEMKRRGVGGSDHLGGNLYVTHSFADVGWMGFVFRIRVRADPELRLLRSLNKPSDEAALLLRALVKQHVTAPTHHSMMLSVYTTNPSACGVTRMARRWVSSHFLSGHIPVEAIELLVASTFVCSKSPVDPPSSVVTGFLRFLELLSEHDWARDPLIVDPHGSFSSDDAKEIRKQFELARGPDFAKGPAMYIISPSDSVEFGEASSTARTWKPTFTASVPEPVVLARAAKVAARSYSFLQQSLCAFESVDWSAAFLESKSSLHSYSALLRVEAGFCVDPASSSFEGELMVHRRGKNDCLTASFTASMESRSRGPKELEFKSYRNVSDRDEGIVILHWNPVTAAVQALALRFGRYALFFYNDLCPDVIAVLWRPLFEPRAFSALSSEYAHPVTTGEWKSDTLVTLNVHDLLREMSQFTRDIVTDVKVLDRGLAILPSSTLKRKAMTKGRPTKRGSSSSNDSSTDGSSSEDDEA